MAAVANARQTSENYLNAARTTVDWAASLLTDDGGVRGLSGRYRRVLQVGAGVRTVGPRRRGRARCGIREAIVLRGRRFQFRRQHVLAGFRKLSQRLADARVPRHRPLRPVVGGRGLSRIRATSRTERRSRVRAFERCGSANRVGRHRLQQSSPYSPSADSTPPIRAGGFFLDSMIRGQPEPGVVSLFKGKTGSATGSRNVRRRSSPCT